MEQLNEVKRGEEAERLMSHPIVMDAFTQVRDGILNAMQDSAFGDQSTHHHLVIALQLLNQIENRLKSVAATGKMAKLQIEQGLAGKIRAAAGF